MTTYVDTLKEQMRTAGVTLPVAPAAAKPSEQEQEAVMSPEERSAIASDPELAALRFKIIDGIFTLQGKRRTRIRCATEDLGYVLLWLVLVPTFSFVLAIVTTFPYYCYECATTTARTCSDLDVPAFEPLMLLSIIAGIVLATWLTMQSRNQWLAYVNRVRNLPMTALLEEWKHQRDLKVMRLEAARRRAEMDYLAQRVASEMKKG